MKEKFGRLSKAPHPELHRLLYAPAFADDVETVLPLLLRINAAHVVMLERCGIIDASAAAALLHANDEIGEASLRAPSSHRGLYAVFEEELTVRAGAVAGGSAHIARSRNDINATVARLRVRGYVLDLAETLTALQVSLLQKASQHTVSVMPGFTHLQPAQPTTLGHYLAGVASEIGRAIDRLLDTDQRADACPMGACAGFGTSFPTQPQLVAELLGFSSATASSLDAVASRDFVVDFLSAAALVGTTLTRLANDLQHWASNAYGFVGWPDDFVSTSSIMPQKRNAFVLETIRGRCATAAGEWTSAVMGLKNTPFANAIEVSADVVGRASGAAGDTRTAVELMTLLIDHMDVDAGMMERSAGSADITATALADMLVRKSSVDFRTAHDAVAGLVSSDVDRSQPADVASHLQRRLGVRVNPSDVASALNPRAVVEAAVSGGGPSPTAVAHQLDTIERSLTAQRQRMDDRKVRDAEAADRLRAEVNRILEGAEVHGYRADRP